jgi:peptidyl-prolyl cis-trans isomerase B (cyclophilin B)
MVCRKTRLLHPLRRLAWLALAGPAALIAPAQDTAGAPPALRADLRAAKPLFNPDSPIRVRFTLTNTTADTVTVPLDQPVASDAITLPAQLVFGSGDTRLLSVTYENDPPKEIPAPTLPPAKTNATTSLRLGPHGLIGIELDLRKYYQHVRYAGTYRLEWRPLGGTLGTAATEFRVEPRKDAVLVTDLPGKITFTLDYDGAPLNVENFVELVRDGFYGGLTFHRVIPGFLIQGGCPSGDGKGLRKDGKTVGGEFRSDVPVEAGTLLMARKPSDPNSASCQFFVALGRLPDLDGQYTVIGHARDTDSLRALQQLAEVPTDRKDRPLSPLLIRSINLVDAESVRTRELEAQP